MHEASRPSQPLIGELTVGEVLERLAAIGPVFHSEADFQHQLAWVVRELAPGVRVRLETRPLPEERLELDVLLTDAGIGERAAVELKYATRALSVEVGSERFRLRNPAAQDVIRHDVVKDLWRLEKLIAAGAVDRGVLLFVTNDQVYWSPSSRDTVDGAFRLHEGRDLAGTLGWASRAGSGTTAKRDIPLALTGRYRLAWSDYSVVSDGPGGKFRVLAVPVGGAGVERSAGPAEPLSSQTGDRIEAEFGRASGSSAPEVARMRAMIEELRAMRNRCEPKSNANPRYLRFSNAISALKWLTTDFVLDDALRLISVEIGGRTEMSASHSGARATPGGVVSAGRCGAREWGGSSFCHVSCAWRHVPSLRRRTLS